MAAQVRVVLNEAGFRDLQRNPGLRDELLRTVNESYVPGVRSRAPKRTGYGASTIHAEPFLDGDRWTIRVGWDRTAYYLRFSQFGTKYMPAHPFLMEGQ